MYYDRVIPLTNLTQIELTYNVGQDPLTLNMSDYFIIFQSNCPNKT